MAVLPVNHTVEYSPQTNTLSIRPKHGRPPGLLDLPRELRDEIYRHAFAATPSLWDRRHLPGCPVHAQHEVAATEPPPFVLHDTTLSYGRAAVEPPARARCRALCLRRHATALLRVSRHLYAEAGPVFWRGKQLCFTSYAAFFELVRGLTDVQCRRIRAVSLQSLGGDHRARPDSLEGREWWRVGLGRALRRLTRLRDLEARRAVLRQFWEAAAQHESRAEPGLVLPRLRTCSVLAIVPLAPDGRADHSGLDPVAFYAGFRQAPARAAVACEVHRRDERRDGGGNGGSAQGRPRKDCVACQILLRQLRAVSGALIAPPVPWTGPVRPWALESVRAYLADHSPVQPAGAPPYVLPALTHAPSGYAYEVTLWGVPTLEAAARESRAEAKRREKLAQALRAWKDMRRVQVDSSRYEEMGLEEGNKAARRRRGGAVEKVDEEIPPDSQTILKERREKRERRLQEEENRASTRAGKIRRRNERELGEQKKALRTRAGKAVPSG